MLKINRYEKIASELHQDHLLLQENLRFISKGQSMEPLLKDGDEILVKRVRAEELHFGDLLTYELNGIFITHRFFYRKKLNQNLYLIVKADNRLRADSPVDPLRLIGKVVWISRQTQKFNLDAFHWRLVFRLIALLSCSEWQLFKVARWVKRGFSRRL